MRKKLGLVSLLLLISLGMGACGAPPGNDIQSEQKETASDTQKAEESESASEQETKGDETMKPLVLIAGEELQYKLIRPNSLNIATTTKLQEFYEDVKKKTGASLRYASFGDNEPETAKEILIGNLAGRAAATDALKTLSYTGCRVEVVGEQIVVSAYSDPLLEKALNKLLLAITKTEDGNWVLPADYFYEYEASGTKLTVPTYETAGTLEGVYCSGQSYFMLSVRTTTAAEVTSYKNKMKENGFELYDENVIGDNRFATYTLSKNGEKLVAHTMYFPYDGTFQVSWGEWGILPETQPLAYPTAPVATPSITQIAREQVYAGWNPTTKLVGGAPGMSYVIQLADGRYILIDGGPADREITLLKKTGGKWGEGETRVTEDAKRLYDFLVANNPNGGKPVIAAWLITHAHSDHIDLANQFLAAYKNDVVVEMAGYNFPDFSVTEILEGGGVSMGNAGNVFRAQLNAMGSANKPKQAILHAGQRLFFPGCEIEILYTQENYFPNPFATGNHTSMVFRVTMENAAGKKTTMMVMGDTERTNCQELVQNYQLELDCDIVQLTHHGFNGASEEIYPLMSPEICFWACDPYRFETDPRCLGTRGGYTFNKWVRENVSKHYTAEVTTTIRIQ